MVPFVFVGCVLTFVCVVTFCCEFGCWIIGDFCGFLLAWLLCCWLRFAVLQMFDLVCNRLCCCGLDVIRCLLILCVSCYWCFCLDCLIIWIVWIFVGVLT